ncbi:MAG: alkanesulfonate monooxygenase SsuD [Paracrocinitomix sp.]
MLVAADRKLANTPGTSCTFEVLAGQRLHRPVLPMLRRSTIGVSFDRTGLVLSRGRWRLGSDSGVPMLLTYDVAMDEKARPMRFGLYDLVEARPGVGLDRLYRERFELIAAAEDAGLWGYHTTEHHLTPLDATPSPSLFLAAAAQHTSTIRLGSLVHVLPLYEPIRLAEELLMLDALTGGRLEIGFGKGVSSPEQRLLGREPDARDANMDDVLEQVLSILRGEPVDGAPIPFRPVQKPYPPLWYAGNADYAGRHNLHVVLGGSADRIIENAHLHKQTAAAHADDPSRLNPDPVPTTAFSRHVLVDTDRDRARRRAIEAWKAYDHNITTHFRRLGEPRQSNPTLDGDGERAIEQGLLAAGDPDDVAANLVQVAALSPVDYSLASFCWGSLDHAEAMASLELFVTQVMPRVQAALAGG